MSDLQFVMTSGQRRFASTGNEDTRNLFDYIRTVKRYSSLIRWHTGFDPVFCRSVEDRYNNRRLEEASKQHKANLEIMLNEGLNPVPVYHFGELEENRVWMFKHFKKVVVDIWPYRLETVGKAKLSYVVRRHLDTVFYPNQGLFKTTATPTPGIYGFRIAQDCLLLRYPWKACTLSSHGADARYGATGETGENPESQRRADYRTPGKKFNGNLPSQLAAGPNVQQRLKEVAARRGKAEPRTNKEKLAKQISFYLERSNYTINSKFHFYFTTVSQVGLLLRQGVRHFELDYSYQETWQSVLRPQEYAL